MMASIDDLLHDPVLEADLKRQQKQIVFNDNFRHALAERRRSTRPSSESSFPDVAPDYVSADKFEQGGGAPWKTPDPSLPTMLALHSELVAFGKWLDATPQEKEERRKIVLDVRAITNALWPEAVVVEFGSSWTGLNLPDGDIDLAIQRLPGPNHVRENLKLLMNQFAKALHVSKIATHIHVIDTARVPIVKFIDRRSGFSVDVAFGLQGVVTKSGEWVVANCQKMPQLKPLLMFLKLFLSIRGLSEPYKGGIGSFMLFTMLLCGLHLSDGARSPEHWRKASLGHLLFEFFRLYSNDMNYKKLGLRPPNGSAKQASLFPRENPSWVISIESPEDSSIDLGRGTFDYPHVIQAFDNAYLTICSGERNGQSLLLTHERSWIGD
ncbi:TRF4/5 nucletotidyl transferase, putative [Perkinsus marinus ATCC 50983]|uniref:TRF4/5 nucletotidyl transferase, putative n=1 Tax=Perkinsus marinus (strain ATCC 50983 / TXsc) TaxID=423536 RepID=C5LCF4_PERM5|nr:TRF4/5 nucletotidyl transferase, putative [Perkinsus marinus ATCC 50983]EER05637.1 TRF4/5 nucletotidyl transferase, putative [Perkinsus marinus ATCC 50983]|eukprot:XP_002773821.1 TRF4/5 nucletotidyl transferase, putative [Perkinsus marinus ATCC 50983]